MAWMFVVVAIVIGACKGNDDGAKREQAPAATPPAPSPAPVPVPVPAPAPEPAAPPAAAAPDPATLCTDYYDSEVKLGTEEGWKLASDSHAPFMAACQKLPLELQRCQGDLDYSGKNSAACDALVTKHIRTLRALRNIVGD